jgi:peptidoglycan/LPS O-acetylase OafA/YrhL
MANIFYALVLIKLGRRTLLILTILAAAGICFISYRAGNLLGGWSKDSFWDGGVRVAYSFTAGLLIYRSNWIIKNGLGFLILAILLSFAFLMPWFSWNWLAEAMVVIFYFPFLVALGAGSTLAPTWKKICRFSGNISYPLYMTHYAAIWIFGNYYTTTKPSTAELTLVVICGTIFLIAFAYLAQVLYDVPVRKYLARK